MITDRSPMLGGTRRKPVLTFPPRSINMRVYYHVQGTSGLYLPPRDLFFAISEDCYLYSVYLKDMGANVWSGRRPTLYGYDLRPSAAAWCEHEVDAIEIYGVARLARHLTPLFAIRILTACECIPF